MGNIAMADDQAFIDYYGILQVSLNCDAKTLETEYRRLAKLYHPDYTDSDDATKFSEITEAYKILRNPKRRAEYDVLYAQNVGDIASDTGAEINEDTALTDADDHAKILMFLYKRRREHAQNPGVVGYFLQEMLNCSHEHFEFHKWYLREKGFVATTEQGTLAITIQGIDHVISMSRTTKAEKLRIAHSSNPD